MTANPEADESHINHENGHRGSTPFIELSIRTADCDISAESSSKKLSWRQRNARIYGIGKALFYNAIAVGFFAWATYHHIDSSNRYDRIDWPPEENTTLSDVECTEAEQCAVPRASPASYCPTFCGIQWCDGFGMLIILYAATYICLFYFQILKPLWGNRLHSSLLLPIKRLTIRVFDGRFRKQIAVGISLIAILAYVVIDALDSLERLQSLSGIVIIIGLAYAFSAHRSQINYQPVFCGFVLQFLLGVVCIRWDVGRSIFECIGDKVATFLNYTDFGSTFIYGAELVDKRIFCFAVLPIVFYFSFCISILYYLGAVQWIVMKIGWMLTSIMGTTVCESVTCAANIFIGMSESPLLIRPYIKLLTHSEVHTIMSSGFATVSGSVLAAYIAYGAEPAHLITSSVMAAPAALGFSKLFYPETEESKTKSDNMVLEKSTDSSILDAASNGALLAISIVLGIAANLIAFVSFVAFLNGVVSYLGFLIGFQDVTFELIFSKLFIPLAWIIGIPWEDCEEVAYVIASKSIINEFVAYERLGVLKRDGLISLRSSAITTYAICGFANPSSMGIMIATMSSLAPEKRRLVTEVAFRAFLAGSMICFLTASIAGVLMNDDMFEEN